MRTLAWIILGVWGLLGAAALYFHSGVLGVIFVILLCLALAG